MLEGLSADSEEKREPVSDIDAVVVDSLKALDPERPIREADSTRTSPLGRSCERFRMPAAHERCRELRRPAYENVQRTKSRGKGTRRRGARYRELSAGHNFEAG
jgi:hypothetical protein